MAEAPEPEILSSFFPDPPPFYKHFTTENQERLKQLKEHVAGSNNDAASSPQLSASQLLRLPTELRYLIPPEPPAEDGEFRVFGEATKARGTDEFSGVMQWISLALKNSQPPLEDWEYQQLYPSPTSSIPGDDPNDQSLQSASTIDRQKYLYRFLRSTLLCFVELLGIVAINPRSEKKDEKLKDILTLVANMHSLINEYRPHQARETLINMMAQQLKRKQEEVAGIRRMTQKVEETLREFTRTAPDRSASVAPADAAAVSSEEKRKDSQRYMWQAMDEILGH